jgi:CHAT domain-containing protein
MEGKVRAMSDFVKGNQEAFGREAKSTFIRNGHELFQSIIPQGPRFEGCSLLTIIPEGILSLIPFEILLTREVEHDLQDYRKLPYLLADKTITYSYSTTLLFYRLGRPAHPSRRILAVAPDYRLDQREISDFIRLHADRMPILKGVVDEVRAIRRIAGGKVLLGREANEHRFKRLAPDYSVLHLAMHTIPDDQEPMNTCLVFTPGKTGGEDGLLFAHELYNYSWNASLAVLSACETGSGQLITGEGVLSLARGFIYAGCPNLIMTLWAVDDKSSQVVMENFYRKIGSGENMADGLRNAKLQYLESADKLHAHPHFWAGYVFLGNNDPAPSSRQPAWLLLAIPAALTLLALFVLIFYSVRFLRKPRT